MYKHTYTCIIYIQNSETHFKVIVVSDKFKGISRVEQHRMVNNVLKNEMGNPIHALSISTKTPYQWDKSKQVNQSPACLGKRTEPFGEPLGDDKTTQ